MSIHDKDLWGRTKHDLAIERIRLFGGKCGQSVKVAFSGGKDSQCCYHLCEEAGIEFDAYYAITRFEPPELMSFICEFYPRVKIERRYKMSLVAEIGRKGLPNRWARWCCDAKHKATKFERAECLFVIGIRVEESPRRAETWRMVGHKPDGSRYLCPIIDWSESDVWEYLGNRPHCSLYNAGYKRIGCVMCPLAPKNMLKDSLRYPKTAAMLRMGANAYVARMRNKGFVKVDGTPCSCWCKANSPENEYWERWVHTGQTCKPIHDLNADDGECLFAGTGFGGNDEFSEWRESE